MKITNRFLLTIFLPVLACLLALSLLLHAVSSRELEEEYEKRLIARTEQIQSEIQAALNLAKSDLLSLLTDKDLEEYFMYLDVGEFDYVEDVRATLEENFLALSKVNSQYASLRLFTSNGIGIVNITNQKRAYKYPDPRQVEWFRNAWKLEENEIYTSHVHPCPEHNLPSLYFNQLFFYWDKPRAVASIHIHCQDYFSDILHDYGMAKNRKVYLVDEQGNFIAKNKEADSTIRRGNPAIIKALIEQKRENLIETDLNKAIPVKNIYFTVGIDGAIGMITQPIAEVEAQSRKLKARLILIAIFIAFLLVGLIYFTLNTIMKPLERLKETTEKIASGDLRARVKIDRNDEIGSLSSSFDAMADNLYQSQTELREALSKVKLLSGFIPICATCKKIRDDKGYWNQVESYIRDHSEAEFSHSICPDCTKDFYAELEEQIPGSKKQKKGSDLPED